VTYAGRRRTRDSDTTRGARKKRGSDRRGAHRGREGARADRPPAGGGRIGPAASEAKRMEAERDGCAARQRPGLGAAASQDSLLGPPPHHWHSWHHGPPPAPPSHSHTRPHAHCAPIHPDARAAPPPITDRRGSFSSYSALAINPAAVTAITTNTRPRPGSGAAMIQLKVYRPSSPYCHSQCVADQPCHGLQQTLLNCIDNSGAAIVECVKVMRMKRHARIGTSTSCLPRFPHL